MDTTPTLSKLKLKIQSLGPLRPAAWQMIMALGQQHQIEAGKNLVRRLGSVVYVAEGLLQEYDHHEREEPAIIHFIAQDQCIVTRGHHQNRQLQTCMPCMVYHWDLASLYQLDEAFTELRPIYDALCAEYDEGVMWRMRLLEMPAWERINAFALMCKPIVPYLKKKDVANYLHLDYDYFVRMHRKLP